MTELTTYVLAEGDLSPTNTLTSEGDIRAALAGYAIAFERWTASQPLPPGAGQAEVLAAYAADVARLVEARGYQSVDVVRLSPDHPERDAMRAKFLAEHVHDDDEVRFFVEGAGAFYFRVSDNEVLRLVCEAGDLVAVPKGVRHWFDTGLAPRFCAIRFFTIADGWVARFTGDRVAGRFDAYAGSAA